MNLRAVIKNAYQALRQNTRRSILTMLGIVIGIASVITILSLGRGFETYTVKNLTATNEKNVAGHCFWPAYELERNAGGIVDSLNRKYFKYVAIQPADNKMDTVPPGRVSNLVYKNTGSDLIKVTWKAPEAKTEMDKARRYVVYGFKRNEKVDIENPANILEICNTNSCTIKLTGKTEILVVTALDRCHNESEGEKLYIRR